MWIRRVAAAGSLRARVAPRVLTAALSTNHYVAQVQATTPHSAGQLEPQKQQQTSHQKSSLEADISTARRLLREKFDMHFLSPAEETVLSKLLAGENVLFTAAANGKGRLHRLQVVSVSMTPYFADACMELSALTA